MYIFNSGRNLVYYSRTIIMPVEHSGVVSVRREEGNEDPLDTRTGDTMDTMVMVTSSPDNTPCHLCQVR